MDRREMVRHGKATLLVATPPAAKSICERACLPISLGYCWTDPAIPLVDEQASNGAWACVQVFVRTPSCGIALPFMQLELDISHCMSEVPNHEDTMRVGMCGDSGDVEELAGIELDARQ